MMRSPTPETPPRVCLIAIRRRHTVALEGECRPYSASAMETAATAAVGLTSGPRRSRASDMIRSVTAGRRRGSAGLVFPRGLAPARAPGVPCAFQARTSLRNCVRLRPRTAACRRRSSSEGRTIMRKDRTASTLARISVRRRGSTPERSRCFILFLHSVPCVRGTDDAKKPVSRPAPWGFWMLRDGRSGLKKPFVGYRFQSDTVIGSMGLTSIFGPGESPLHLVEEMVPIDHAGCFRKKPELAQPRGKQARSGTPFVVPARAALHSVWTSRREV